MSAELKQANKPTCADQRDRHNKTPAQLVKHEARKISRLVTYPCFQLLEAHPC